MTERHFRSKHRHAGKDRRHPGYMDVPWPFHPWNLGSGTNPPGADLHLPEGRAGRMACRESMPERRLLISGSYSLPKS
jgi:hypothetical protein